MRLLICWPLSTKQVQRPHLVSIQSSITEMRSSRTWPWSMLIFRSIKFMIGLTSSMFPKLQPTVTLHLPYLTADGFFPSTGTDRHPDIFVPLPVIDIMDFLSYQSRLNSLHTNCKIPGNLLPRRLIDELLSLRNYLGARYRKKMVWAAVPNIRWTAANRQWSAEFTATN